MRTHLAHDAKIRNGRLWLYFVNHTKTLGFEWDLLHPRLSIGIGLADMEHAISAHFCIGLINLYLWYESWKLHQWISSWTRRPDQLYSNGRTIGFSWYQGSLSIDLWYDPMEHRRVDPKWWHLYITPVDIIFGHTKYTELGREKVHVEVPMPEACYPATVELYEAEWRRPRWPGVWRRIKRCTITPDTPIPVPGKGENAWDCGEDATHSLTCPAKDAHEAVVKLVSSVLEKRYRRGGKLWRPESNHVRV